MSKSKVQTISGYTLKEPHLTPMAVWLVLLKVALPVLIIGGAVDLLIQVTTGVCTGLWCLAK